MTTRLREWRQRRELSLRRLAALADVHFTTIVRIERDEMSPTLALLEKLAVALEVRVRDMLPVEKRPRRRNKA
jgi:transcriptional regulator with XRE-family HTH domain